MHCAGSGKFSFHPSVSFVENKASGDAEAWNLGSLCTSGPPRENSFFDNAIVAVSHVSHVYLSMCVSSCMRLMS